MRVASLMALTALVVPGAAAAQGGLGGWDPEEVTKAQKTAADFLEADANLRPFFEQGYAYAAFPSIAKAAFIIGGAHGKGTVFRNGGAIGKTEVTQATVGLQLGAQSYREVIFFQNKEAFDRFTGGSFELAAQVSAVVIKQGVSANVAYEGGIAVVTMPNAGAMVEASVGGQKFKYEPKG